MTKRSLAAQLRNHAVQKGDFSVTEMDDDAVLTKYTCCSACGAYHVTGETLDRLIESSLDEKDFRTLWNDRNGSFVQNGSLKFGHRESGGRHVRSQNIRLRRTS
jgi:hypothetical protein